MNANYFEMGFAEDLPDRVQVAHVQIINKLSLEGCGFDVGYFSVEAKVNLFILSLSMIKLTMS